MRQQSLDLNGIRVQTARMMEIYSLLKRELEKNSLSISSVIERQQLASAIETIKTNMQQTLILLNQYQSQSDCASLNDQVELQDLLESVVKWHQANINASE